MKFVCLLTVLFSLNASAQYSGSYSDRSREVREQEAQQYHANEVARTQKDNNNMIAAAEAYARSKGTEIQAGTMKCPLRRDIYWYGFNVPSASDPWYSMRYQYCEFNAGSDACTIGMTFETPVYVSCIGTDGKKTRYTVAPNGRVSVVKKDGEEAKAPDKRARRAKGRR